VDKPLSQERLKGAPNTPVDYALSNLWGAIEIADHINKNYAKVEVGTLQFILSEVKRLQAIEAERDRYKATLQEIRRITPYGMYHEMIDETLKGADTNETN
jgi:hypothetical protein